MRHTILSILALFCCIAVRAQTVFSGKVISFADNLPLAGANVSIKGTKESTSTNGNGIFSLSALTSKLTLNISYVGYQSKEVEVSATGKNAIVIKLVPDVKQLSEVTVSTGYQYIPKERSTGSFSQINNKLLNEQVTTDVLSRLPAIANGLLNDRGTNLSGQLLIRRAGTILGPKQPLIVLNNFPYEGDISNINPNDVESVTLLKDAAAASIWGARAGNGVIVITTKNSNFNEPMSVDFNSNITISGKPNLSYIKQITSSDFIDVEQMLYGRGFYDDDINGPDHFPLSPVVELLHQKTQGTISEADANAHFNTLKNLDVRDQFTRYVYQPAVNQQYALTLKGGTAKFKWLAFTGYDRNESDLDAAYDRLNLNFHNTIRPLKNLVIETGMSYTQSKSTAGKSGYGDITQKFGQYFLPYMQLADKNGNPLPVVKELSLDYISDAGEGKLLDWHYYPLDDYKHSTSVTDLSDILINAGINYQFMKGLSAEVKYRYEREETGIRNLSDPESYFARDLINRFTQISPAGDVSHPVPVGGILDITHSFLESGSLRGQLSFERDWKGSNIVAIAGTEIRSSHSTDNSNRFYGYNSDNLSFGNVDVATPYPDFVTGYDNFIPGNRGLSDKTIRYVSYFGNAAWTLHSQYTLSVSGRRDASNLFGLHTNDLWNPFWSAGAAWILSSADFYKSSLVPYLKLRTTYGTGGNVNPAMAAATTIQYFTGVNPYTGTPFSYFSNYYNPDLKWETSRMINLAIDFRIKDNFLSGSIDWYHKKGTNLFGTAQLDYTGGVGSQIIKNVAATKGNGVDIQLNSINMNRRFKWTTTLNYSYSNEKVVTYYLNSQQGSKFISNNSTVPVSGVEGKPVYSIFAYKWAGLDPESGDPQGFIDGKVSTDYGNMIYNSVLSDLKYFGSAIPTQYGSLINTVSYKAWSLDIGIVYKLGYYFRRSSINYSDLFNYWVGNADYAKRWQKPGDELKTNVPSMTYPAISSRDNFYAGSEVLVDKGDHIRLQYMNLSLEFPHKQMKKQPFQLIRLYGSVNNIGILWRANKNHIDPDYNYGPYPLIDPRTWSLGIRITP